MNPNHTSQDSSGPFPLVELPTELQRAIIAFAIPTRRLDRTERPAISIHNDQHVHHRTVLKLRLTSKWINELVLTHLSYMIAEHDYAKGHDIVHYVNPHRDWLNIIPSRLYPGRMRDNYFAWVLQSDHSKIASLIYNKAPWANIMSSSPDFQPIDGDWLRRQWRFRNYTRHLKANLPNLRNLVLSVKYSDLYLPLSIAGYECPGRSSKRLSVRRPTDEDSSSTSLRYVIPPWRFPLKLSPIDKRYVVELDVIKREERILSIRGWSREGGYWAGFYYCTITDKTYFTAIQCRDIIETFGLTLDLDNKRDYTHLQIPRLAMRMWIDPPVEFRERFEWFEVKDWDHRGEEDDSKEVKRTKEIAKIWHVFHTFLIERLIRGCDGNTVMPSVILRRAT